MALNLKSISELSPIAEGIENQINAISSTVANNGKAYIEVSYKENANKNIDSNLFDFGLFMKYVIDYLSMLSANFANYLPLTAYADKFDIMFKHLSDDFLPENYVYTKYKDEEQYIYGKKVFSVNGKNPTKFLTPVEILTANINTANITEATITDLTASNSILPNVNSEYINTTHLTCAPNDAELTAKSTRWN